MGDSQFNLLYCRSDIRQILLKKSGHKCGRTYPRHGEEEKEVLWQESPRIGGDYDYQLFAASHTVKSCEDGRKLGARYNRVRAEGAVVVAVYYAVCHCPADSIAVARGNVG